MFVSRILCTPRKLLRRRQDYGVEIAIKVCPTALRGAACSPIAHLPPGQSHVSHPHERNCSSQSRKPLVGSGSLNDATPNDSNSRHKCPGNKPDVEINLCHHPLYTSLSSSSETGRGRHCVLGYVPGHPPTPKSG